MTEERTLHRTCESRVAAWVNRVSWGCESGLEFGCGFGVYTREMTCHVRAGIEAFEPYVIEARETPANAGIEFIHGDMRYFESFIIREYDLALFVDSLEHIAKADGLFLIERCKEHFKKIAVFVPIGPHEQEPCDGNEMQRHISTWNAEDLAALGFKYMVDPVFHHNNPEDKQAAAFAEWVRP